jgi:gamma-glutamyltranspeptidase/glutathione hydrolase
MRCCGGSFVSNSEDDMRLPSVVLVVMVGALTTVAAQLPGDRPAGNPRGTRSPAVGRNGMIATSQPLASAAGLRVLQEGGNAIDAAVTAAAVLAVVEPAMTGAGGDVFALVYDARTKQLKGLNSSGRAGARADADMLVAKGHTMVPAQGLHAITVPGAVAGWAELLEKHGTIPLARALEPAIRYARDGFPVAEIIASEWNDATKWLSADAAAAAVFLPGGRAPRPGEIFRNPDLANTLETIAKGGRAAFYTGPIARAIADLMQARGGFVTADDLARHTADWVEPIATNYRGYDVYEMPPNTQGFVALEMLNILEGFDLKALGHNSAEHLHLVAEAKRIAFADRAAYLSDFDHVRPEVLRTLISKDYAATRRREIDRARAAADYKPGAFAPGTSAADAYFDGRDLGDTVYLAAADGTGNAISFINSLFSAFGSGVVVPGTGLVLHNRGSGFTLQKGHPNRLAPGKRPLHTLVPAMLVKDGRPLMPFGVMGGDNQAQAHAQVVINMVDFGMNVQQAGEVARARHAMEGLMLESAVPEAVRADLQRRGHKIIDGRGNVGGYQAVFIDPKTGVLLGGSDPRKDGLAIGW